MLVVGLFAVFPAPTFALFEDSKEAVCEGIQGSSSGGDCTTGGTTLDNLLTTAIQTISVIVGIVAVIMLVYGGFKYITAGGDSNNIQSAKSTILYAIIGLLVVALAQFIVQFVLDKAV